MIFNSQGAAELKTYINGGRITPGDEEVTLPKGAELLGDVVIEAIRGAEGAHAWEKYDYESKTVTLRFTHIPRNILVVSSDDIDVHSIDSSFFVGHSGTYANSGPYEFISETELMFDRATVFTFTYDAATARITTSGNISSSVQPFTDSTQTKVKKDFICYVVDDDGGKYPESGLQDGYWYKACTAALPYAVELKCIRSTGTQRIETGFTPNQDTRVVMDADTTASKSLSFPALFFTNSAGSAQGRFGMMLYTGQNGFHDHYGTQVVNSSNKGVYGRHIFEKNKNVSYLDGVAVSNFSYASFQSPITLSLFCSYENGSYQYYINMELYSCQIYSNGTLVRDYIPVLDHAGIACLYDKVGKQLYYNQGSGSFEYELAA